MSIVVDALNSELRELAQKSKQYNAQIKQAKTRVKKDYFTKKLRKNSTKIADVLMALQRVNSRKLSMEDLVHEQVSRLQVSNDDNSPAT